MSSREIIDAIHGRGNEVKPTKPTSRDLALFLKQSMDILAEEKYGEFGYDTCKEYEKLEILKELFERNWIE